MPRSTNSLPFAFPSIRHEIFWRFSLSVCGCVTADSIAMYATPVPVTNTKHGSDRRMRYSVCYARRAVPLPRCVTPGHQQCEDVES